SVVYQYVEFAVGLNRGVDERLNLIRGSDVAKHCFCFEPFTTKLLNSRPQPVTSSGTQHQRRPSLSKPFRHLFSQSARTAGNNRYPPRKIEEILNMTCHVLVFCAFLWLSVDYGSSDALAVKSGIAKHRFRRFAALVIQL